MNTYLLLVGDKFESFTTKKDAITLTRLQHILKGTVKAINSRQRTVLVPGQGLGDRKVELLLKLYNNSPYKNFFDVRLLKSLPKRASSLHSHKHQPENTLISEPRHISGDEYELQLLIDEECELMQDHQSGQHVQGMILMEAARQCLLAVTEVFFLPKDHRPFAFIFNDMSVSFNNFAFPLAAHIKYCIKEKKINMPKRVSFSTEIYIEQCGVRAAACNMSFTAYESRRISTQEASAAEKMFNKHMAEVAGNLALKPNKAQIA